MSVGCGHHANASPRTGHKQLKLLTSPERILPSASYRLCEHRETEIEGQRNEQLNRIKSCKELTTAGLNLLMMLTMTIGAGIR